jgi:hypothetical protein
MKMKTKVSVSLDPELSKAVLQVARELADSDARLIIYFASSSFAPVALAQQMSAAFPGIPTVGCTTAGEMVSGRMLQGSLAAMALGSELVARVDARLVSHLAEDTRGGVAKAFADFSRFFGRDVGALDPERYVGLVLADGLSGAEERLMDAIGDRTNVSFVGGSAGDDLKFQQTRVFLGATAASNAAVLVLIEPAAPFQIVKTQSFRVLPTRLVATKVNEPMRRVIEFNGEPAALAYARAVGVPVEQANTRFMTNPLGLLAGDEVFVRSPQRIDGGSIYFYCSVIEGTELALLESTDIVADTQKAVAAVQDASAVLDFCCILRTLELREKGRCDHYASIFARTPTLGFSTYGEEYIGHINQTSTMLVFRSRQGNS